MSSNTTISIASQDAISKHTTSRSAVPKPRPITSKTTNSMPAASGVSDFALRAPKPRPITSKSTDSKPATSESALRVPKPKNQLITFKSTVSVPADSESAVFLRPTAFKSGTSRTASFKSNTKGPSTVQDEDSDFYVEEGIEGMSDEDDSLELAVAMSSPLKGTEFCNAQKIN